MDISIGLFHRRGQDQHDRKETRAFEAAFKLQVVRTIRVQGLSVEQVCRDMNLVESAVRRWVDAGHRGLHCDLLKRHATAFDSGLLRARLLGAPAYGTHGLKLQQRFNSTDRLVRKELTMTSHVRNEAARTSQTLRHFVKRGRRCRLSTR